MEFPCCKEDLDFDTCLRLDCNVKRPFFYEGIVNQLMAPVEAKFKLTCRVTSMNEYLL